MPPQQAAKAWLKVNLNVLEQWLDGVKTLDGKPGKDALLQYLHAS
jgi:glycine betaine/proline transport system substrate-binding protein